MKNKLACECNEDMDHFEAAFGVPAEGAISNHWLGVLPEDNKKAVNAFACNQRLNDPDHNAPPDLLASHASKVPWHLWPNVP
jgi:hypothetical protein